MSGDREPTQLANAALSGDRTALARLLSSIEGGADGSLAALASLFPKTGSAFVVGATGPPGSGKSTLTDGLIRLGRSEGHAVAVIAVDPSSPFTGGAILGDRIRMQEHADDDGVYIRSMASRGQLGGIAEATPKAISVLDAVGYPYVFVETVGVGQSEVDIARRADTTVVIVNPRWGDSIQAAKAGLLEAGDVFVVNKADLGGVDETIGELRQMLEMGASGDWEPPILSTIATSGAGIAEVWEAVAKHRAAMGPSELNRRRIECLESDLRHAVASELRRRAKEHGADERFHEMLLQVTARDIDPWSAARLVIEDGA